MSSTRVKKISFVLDAAITWAANTLTVVTTANHNLVTGDKVSIHVQNVPQEIVDAVVTVTNATTFTIVAPAQWKDVAVPQATFNGKVTVAIFNAGVTGRFVFTAPRSISAAAVIQSFITGTGGAGYTVDGSLDGVHWTNIATVTHVSNDVQSAQVAPAWAYLSINITSIGASTSLVVMYSA